MIVLASLLTLFGCQSPQNGFEGDTITYFSLSEGGGMNRFGGFKYRIEETKDGKVHFLFNEGYPDEKEFVLEDHSVFDSLQQIVLKHKMYRYKGNYQPPFHITDGESWSLYVKYASRETISAGGYMAGPDGYREAFNDIIQCLQPWKEMPTQVNELVRFKYTYGTTTYLIERKDDHALLTVDDEKENRHEVYQKSLDMLEELRVLANIEGLKENGVLKSDDPNHIPFLFELEYSNGLKYSYQSYDLNYQCHYTEVLQYFFQRWTSDSEENNN